MLSQCQLRSRLGYFPLGVCQFHDRPCLDLLGLNRDCPHPIESNEQRVETGYVDILLIQIASCVRSRSPSLLKRLLT